MPFKFKCTTYIGVIMTKSRFTREVEQLNHISDFSEFTWGSIKPEYAARMRLQNQFKSGY